MIRCNSLEKFSFQNVIKTNANKIILSALGNLDSTLFLPRK